MRRSTRRRYNRKPIFGTGHIVLILFVLMVTAALVLLFTDTLGLASSLRGVLTASKMEVVDEEGIKNIEGDYTVDQPGERLEDMHIYGNLYLGAGIGDGSVDLVNIIVDGSVLVQGGGMNSVYINNCTFKELKVNRPAGMVKLVATGETLVEKVILETSTRLVENLADGFYGFRSIDVLTADKIELSGDFELLNVAVQDAYVEIDSKTLTNLNVAATAVGSAIQLPDGFFIEKLQVDGACYLLGQGEIAEAVISASGITEMAGRFSKIMIISEAGQLDLGEESAVSELLVAKHALNNVLNLSEMVELSYLELNEAVEVKGAGEIEMVVINAPGSRMEQIPAAIEFGDAVSVVIAGYEISSPEMLRGLREHDDPLYYAEAITIEQDDTAPVPDPEPAPDPVPDPATVPAPDPAPAPAPLPTPEPIPTPAPAAVKEFKIGPGLTPGKKIVTVSLTVEDPQNYKVVVSSIELDPLYYEGKVIGFKKELDEKIAEDADKDRSKIVVIKLGS
jgi:hypothetical protein